MKTRTELANRAKMKLPTVSRALNGKHNLTLATMKKMAAALDAVVHVYVERRDVRGAWVPVEQMLPPGIADTSKRPGASDATNYDFPWSAPEDSLVIDLMAVRPEVTGSGTT